jgi:tetratricopeptide (TPR) repeat protein
MNPMRILIALTLYVSFAAGAFAEAPNASIKEVTPDWMAMHDKGLEANAHQNYAEAADYFKQSWSLAGTAVERGVSENDLGQTYRRLKRAGDAKEWLERAYLTWKAIPRADRNLVVSASCLAELYRNEGNYQRAEALLREAMSIRNSDPQSKENIRNALADLLREEGESPEARQLFEDSLKENGVSWQERANALSGLADIDRQAGDWEASAQKWNQVLELASDQKDAVAEAVAARGLAAMWLETGQVARSEPLFRRAVRLVENSPDALPDQLAAALSGIGGLYRVENKLTLAEDAFLRALQLDRAALGEAHPQVAWLMEMLSDVYSTIGERDKALDYASKAVSVMQGLFGDASLPAAASMANRATVEQREKELDAALRDFDRALGIARSYPGNEVFKQTLTARYAALLKLMHRDREAKGLSAIAKSFR